MIQPLVFTGAGISAGAGLPTFANANWRGQDIREFLDIQLLRAQPDLFREMYEEVFIPWKDARPSKAHLLVAQAGYPVVTQNIDGLHQKAGSKHVVEVHGSIYRLLCESCGFVLDTGLNSYQVTCPSCERRLRPDIVLFGEQIYHWEKSLELLERASRLIVIGTSLTVYPACLLESLARRRGMRVDIINEDADNNIERFL